MTFLRRLLCVSLLCARLAFRGVLLPFPEHAVAWPTTTLFPRATPCFPPAGASAARRKNAAEDLEVAYHQPAPERRLPQSQRPSSRTLAEGTRGRERLTNASWPAVLAPRPLQSTQELLGRKRVSVKCGRGFGCDYYHRQYDIKQKTQEKTLRLKSRSSCEFRTERRHVTTPLRGRADSAPSPQTFSSRATDANVHNRST